jgi:AraC-like DNA-binding protein
LQRNARRKELMSTALRIAHGAFGRVALLDMDRPLVRHAHHHCHVLLKVEGADTHFMVGDQVTPLTDTAAVLVDGWKPHAYVHDANRPRTLIMALYIEPEWLKEFRRGWAASGAPGFFERPSGEVSPRIRQLTLHLAAEMMANPDAVRTHEQTLSDLMIAVIERFTPWRSFPISIRGMSAVSCDWRIRRAMDAMRVQDSYGSIDQFVKRAGLSRAQFFRLFKTSLGVSPKIYLNVVRMERALEAVMREDTPLGELSERFGFPEPAHFTRFFRDHAGVSPREFRNVSRLAG